MDGVFAQMPVVVTCRLELMVTRGHWHNLRMVELRLLCARCCHQARMRKDMARLEAQRQELSDRITSLQASIFKGSEKLDQVSRAPP